MAKHERAEAKKMILTKKRRIEGEKGEIMLEAIIILTVTMFILFWLIGLSFLYYERYVISIVTNDAAKKVAASYNYPNSDVIMGYVDVKTVISKDTYRHFGLKGDVTGRTLQSMNVDRAEAYVKYMLDITNFPGTVENVEVTLKQKNDAMLRKHIEVTTTCKMFTPLSGVFDFFGMEQIQEFGNTAYAEVVDYQDYYSTVAYAKSFESALSSCGSFLKSIQKALNTAVKCYNHFSKKLSD